MDSLRRIPPGPATLSLRPRRCRPNPALRVGHYRQGGADHHRIAAFLELAGRGAALALFHPAACRYGFVEPGGYLDLADRLLPDRHRPLSRHRPAAAGPRRSLVALSRLHVLAPSAGAGFRP